VKLRCKFRFYPTDEQALYLGRVFGCCRFVYNWGLKLRRDAWHAGERVNYGGTSAALTALKKQPEYAWLREVSSVPPQQALRHLQAAYTNFFQKRARYPSFKKKHGKQSAEYTRSGFMWDAATHTLNIAKLGKLKVRWSREFESDPSTVTITKDRAGRYFITLVLDEQIKALPKTGKPVGVDLGITRLATLSNGEIVENWRFLQRVEKKLAKAQRVLSRRKKASKRRERARRRVAQLQAQIADARLDRLHKVTTDLVRRFDLICVEDLAVKQMLGNKRLAKHLSDAAFGTFRALLTYKCKWYGKELIVIDRFYPSSKRCSVCGSVRTTLPLGVRQWTCKECGAEHDRDENAAKNILAAGHAVTARGGSVRPQRATARRGTIRRTVNQPGNCERSSHHSPSGIPVL
jgi:putative transposase